MQILTAVRGWPGVGKTTIAQALAYDPEVQQEFMDGILWTSLGQNPDLFAVLCAWGRATGCDILRSYSMDEASASLRGRLRDRRMLLIVDDVWEAEHLATLQVGGGECALLATTRLNSVAQEIATTPQNIFKLDVLSDEKAFELFGRLAPKIAEQHSQATIQLLHELEGLPLAIQVAGRMLQAEYSYGFGVENLLDELRAGKHLLSAKAPLTGAVTHKEMPSTVGILLQKSTDRLDAATRDRFAFLGAFAPKPTTFDVRALRAIWEIDDPKPTIRTLVDRGLLEVVEGSERFQMHALLVWHARSLCTEE